MNGCLSDWESLRSSVNFLLLWFDCPVANRVRFGDQLAIIREQEGGRLVAEFQRGPGGVPVVREVVAGKGVTQRTGRIDRLGCKAEGRKPIVV